MSLSQEPYVFIIDLDGTIIGDCVYQVMLYEIENVLKKNSQKSELKKLLDNNYNPSSKLIRPHFKYFINTIKKLYPNSSFYIYTASEKKWANIEITLIEKSHGIKFNRPLFTREDCLLDSNNMYKKSVKKILPKILKGNKNLNPSNILVIDNNDVFIDYKNNFLLCPSYNYVLFQDVWDKLKIEHLKILDIYKLIANLINNNKICKYFKESPNGLDAELKHKWLYKKHRKINKMNAKYKNDDFWKRLCSIIIERDIKTFDKNTVSYLNTELNKK